MKKGPNVKTDSLFKLIRDANSQDQALKSLKEVLKNVPSISSLRQWHHRTVLSAAAVRGYTKVLQYLIETKGADPTELYLIENKKITVLETAILNNQIDSAIYLTEKFKSFIEGPKNGECLALTLAIKNNQLELAKKIFTQDPNQLHKVTFNKKIHYYITRFALLLMI